MTQEEIQKKAEEVYPKDICGYTCECRVGAKPEPLDYNEDRRNAYIKALTEIEELPKIKGWAVKDPDGTLFIGNNKPRRLGGEPEYDMWVDLGEFMKIPNEMLPNITWDSDPIEVELLIRRVSQSNTNEWHNTSVTDGKPHNPSFLD
jgi:hypothetical protein